MFKKVLFTHDDLDGAGCRIVFEIANTHLVKDKDYAVIHGSPGSEGPDNIDDKIKKLTETDIDTDTEIFFADVCASPSMLMALKNNNCTVRIFDHHKTNMYAKDIFPDAIVIPDVDEDGIMQSGTSLLYNYLVEKVNKKGNFLSNKYIMKPFTRLFVYMVRSYDTFEWKETNNIDAKKLQVLFGLLGMNRFCDKYVRKISSSEKKLFRRNELDFIDAQLEIEDRIINNFSTDDVVPINVKNHNCALVLGSTGANISRLGNDFLTKHPEYDFIAQFTINKTGSFGFRAVKPNIDLSELAKSLGGGGHRLAAGVALSSATKDKIINLLIKELNR